MDSFIDFFEENSTKNLLQVKKVNPTERSLLPKQSSAHSEQLHLLPDVLKDL